MTGEYDKTPATSGSDPGAGAGATGAGAGGTGSIAPSPHRHEAWQPRVLKDAPFNAFESDAARSPDAAPPSSTIRDPERDTAPLQGEKDLSDDDSLANEYSRNQDHATTASGSPSNDRDTQS